MSHDLPPEALAEARERARHILSGVSESVTEQTYNRLVDAIAKEIAEAEQRALAALETNFLADFLDRRQGRG